MKTKKRWATKQKSRIGYIVGEQWAPSMAYGIVYTAFFPSHSFMLEFSLMTRMVVACDQLRWCCGPRVECAPTSRWYEMLFLPRLYSQRSATSIFFLVEILPVNLQAIHLFHPLGLNFKNQNKFLSFCHSKIYSEKASPPLSLAVVLWNTKLYRNLS